MQIGNHFPRLVAVVWFVLAGIAYAVADNYPGRHWQTVSPTEQAHWSVDGLAAARAYANTLDTAAVFVAVGGRVLSQWGDSAGRYNVHSIRKSYLSALVGTAVQNKLIRLDATLAELGIDDYKPALTKIEKQATVRDLLKARSGVYHSALYETAGMAATRPLRGSHAPGTFWYYNNWDFNALGTIYEQAIGNSLFDDFKASIAEPLEMEDFRRTDAQYVTGPDSMHRAYPFSMSARDMARFGLLYLRAGVWKGRQIVPRQWVVDSVTSYSDAGSSGGYGYMWWVSVHGQHLGSTRLPDGSFSARGAGGHYILVIPAYDLVIVHRVNNDNNSSDETVNSRQFGKLVQLILAARR